MLNIAVIMGRLTATPELRTTANGIPVTSFSVAVDRSYSSRNGGDRQTDFINVVAWRSTAEFICRYFTKGQMIAINGSIQVRNYEDRQGVKRTAVEIVADAANFCGSKRESGGGDGSYGGNSYGGGSYGGGGGYGGYNRDEPSPDPEPDRFPDDSRSPAQSAPAFSSGDDAGFESIFSDDDLPF